MKLNVFNTTVTIITLLFIACLATFIYMSIDIKDRGIISPAKSDDKPVTENNQQPKGHSHNGKRHEHEQQPETDKPTNKLTTQTQEISTSTATPIYGTDFDIEEHLKRPDVQKQLAAAEKRFQDFIDNHPALQPQAKADMATIREYVRAEKEFHQKNFTLHEQRKPIDKERDALMAVSFEELITWSKKEQREHLDKLKSIRKKRIAHGEKIDAHNKTDPVYPAAAYKRMKALRQSMLENDQLHFSK